MRDKNASIRQKEGERDKVQGELSALNRQADSRAQLGIKRNEVRSKQSQIEASYVLRSREADKADRDRIASHAPRFRELVEADLNAETMEEKITSAVGSVRNDVHANLFGANEADGKIASCKKQNPRHRLAIDYSPSSRPRSTSPSSP